MVIHTSRVLAIRVLGQEAVLAYEQVKRFYARLGHALEAEFARAVGGQVGRSGEADVLTQHGWWEFQTQENTKNAAGAASDLARVGPGRCVQVLGLVLAKNRISAVEFLMAHGVTDPEAVAEECIRRAVDVAAAPEQQMRIPLV